jgi:membrane protease YdiL (CAAX protease family)
MMIDTPKERGALIKELGVFLILTFAATFVLETTAIWGDGSGGLSSKWLIVPMYIPAVSAILCMLWFRSPALTREAKQFLAMFLIASAVTLFEGLYQPVLGMIGPFPLMTTIVSIAAFLAAVLLNVKSPGREAMGRAKLAFGKNYREYLIVPVLFAALYVAGLFISHMLELSLPTSVYNPFTFFVFLGIYPATFLITWPKYFGEEYGWRVYLQDRIFALFGGYKGVVLIGIIWGLWHLPLNLAGMSFSGNPVAGNILYIVYTVIIGIIFSYAVLKTGSIWIAVLLHALTDSIVSIGYIYIANGNVLVAFLPVVILMGVFAAVLLRSKVWTGEISPVL